MVFAGEDLELSGLKLKLPFWTFIGGGAIAAGVLAALASLQNRLAVELENELTRHYANLGYTLPRENANRGLPLSGAVTSTFSTFGGPSPSMVRSLLAYATVLITAACWILLPVAAQIAAMVKLGTDFAWTWEVWLPLGLSLLLTGTAIAWGMFSGYDPRLRPQDQGKS